jgi:hypothetical protein
MDLCPKTFVLWGVWSYAHQLIPAKICPINGDWVFFYQLVDRWEQV